MSSSRTRNKQTSAKKDRPSSAPQKKGANSKSLAKKRAHSHPLTSTLPKLKNQELFPASDVANIATFEENLIDEHFEKLNISHRWKTENTNLTQPMTNYPISWEIDIKPFSGNSSAKVEEQQAYLPKLDSVEEYVAPRCTCTSKDISQRKVLDLTRWHCISRPQYSKSCGMSSLISCWNFLFSTLGHGDRRPITQEEALLAIGFKPPFEEIKFGPFTGNATLMRWFRQLNDYYKVRGRCHFMYKPKGMNSTTGIDEVIGLQKLKEALKNPRCAIIYHCYNHYMCPIGYEDTPIESEKAYSRDYNDNFETWLIIGDTSRKHPSMHCKQWKDIVMDLNTESPEYFDIRKSEKGLQTLQTAKKPGRNLHCLMAFEKCKPV
ncbi:DgyrCDS6734 [Dimorphilus gyrociliatus]|uniref:DgyrCDS6734 n=1 Tax=Dimorphilus gyrociliatus TaxID=2664684 RepID=A0A7I8VRL7_9ANNE|nr:DgyrCDS6734 [Dimorphilus gyrociliatus]